MAFLFFKKSPAHLLRLCIFAGVLTGTTTFADVTVLGSWENGPTHTVVAGSARALLVFVYGEHTASFSATGVTYGTRAMTKIIDKAFAPVGLFSYTSAWILKEADIATASSSAIAVTWSAAPSVGFTVESVFLTGVDQAVPIGGQASNGSSTLATITTAALSTPSAHMVFVAGTSGTNASYTVNNGFTKAWEWASGGFGDAVAGYKAGTGADETPSLTIPVAMRQTIIGFVVRGNDAPGIWNGGGGTDSWTTDANWSGGAYPRGGEEIVFDGTAQTAVNHNHTAATSYNSITFNPGAAAFTLSGNSITLAGNIINHSSNLQTFNLDISLVGMRAVHTPGGNVTLGGVISGAGGLLKDWGDNTLTLSGSNTYTGMTWIKIGCLSIKTIQNVSGGASNVGAPVTAENGTIWIGYLDKTGKLLYTGAGNTTNRVIDLYGTTGGATIDQSGTGLLKFTRAFTATSGSDSTVPRWKTLTLLGSTAGTGEIAGAIVNPSGAGGYTTSLTKAGSGLWTLSGTSTYTGVTRISAGTLNVTGSLATGSAVTVSSGATLTGNGTLAGNVAVSGGGTVAPGTGTIGTLNTGALTLNGASMLNPSSINFECAAPGTSDKIAVNGNLILDGVLNVTALSGFAAGNYTLLTCSGTLMDKGLTVGTMPAGYTGVISVGANAVVLTVTSSSGLPTILTSPADLRIYTGDSATFSVSASGTGLSYQWQRSADGTTWSNVTAGIGGTTSTYRFQTLAADANALFRCVVSNSFGPVTSASARLKLCARISAPADQLNKKSGDAVTFSVTPSAVVISYSWWRSPDGIVWSQIAGQTGNTYTMTVQPADTLVKFQCRMTDSCGTQTSATATLTANPQNNNPPGFISAPDSLATEDQLWSYTPLAVDVDAGDTVAYSLRNPPSGMAVAGNKVAWTPTNANAGSNIVIIRATDSRGAFSDQTFRVRVINVNDAPTIISSAPTAAVQNQPFQYQAQASDPDVGDVLTWQLTTAPTGMSISASGLVTWTPTPAQIGSNNVVIQVRDAAGATAQQSFSITVTNINDAPVIADPTAKTASEDVQFTLQLAAVDPDGNQVFWFVLQGSDSLKIDMSTGMLTWTPRQNVAGTAVQVKIRATDAVLSDTTTFSIAITAVNDPPVITTVLPGTFRIDTLYSIPLTATDEEGNPVTWSIPRKPATMNIISNILVWAPTSTGLDTITIVATDGNGFDTLSVEVQILGTAVSGNRSYSATPVSLGLSATHKAGSITIMAGLPERFHAGTVTLFSISGKKLAEQAIAGAGWHALYFRNVPSGAHLLRLNAGGKMIIRRMFL